MCVETDKAWVSSNWCIRFHTHISQNRIFHQHCSFFATVQTTMKSPYQSINQHIYTQSLFIRSTTNASKQSGKPVTVELLLDKMTWNIKIPFFVYLHRSILIKSHKLQMFLKVILFNSHKWITEVYQSMLVQQAAKEIRSET